MNGCKYIYVITAVICVYIYIYIYIDIGMVHYIEYICMYLFIVVPRTRKL
jgi:hypothetical protein